MSSALKVLVASNCEYFLGVFTSYFYFRSSSVSFATSSADNIENITSKINPNILILDVNLLKQLINNNKWVDYNNIINNLNISVCGLIDKNKNIDHEKKYCRFERIFQEPLDINQFDEYLLSKINESQSDFLGNKNDDRRIEDRRRQDRRNSKNELNSENKINRPFRIDDRAKIVWMNDKALDLTPKEYELLNLFVKDINRVIPAHEIIDHLWPKSSNATKADLHQYIHLLRKKIEIDPKNPKWLITVKGFGYRLNIPKTVSRESIFASSMPSVSVPSYLRAP